MHGKESLVGAPHSPIGSRRRLGAELRRLRTNSGLTLDDVAERMTCSTSKISRLETGKGIPKVPDVRELMRIYEVRSETEQEMLLRLVHDGREHGWWESYGEGVQPERFVLDAPTRYAALETAASRVWAFEPMWIHGLLQSTDYARGVLRGMLGEHHDAGEIERLVELRMRRQQALHRRRPPLSLHVVLDEAVLAHVVGSPEVTAAALRFLLERMALPTVDLRVLPFTAGVHRAQVGPVVVLEFPPGAGTDAVNVESHAGETLLESPRDVMVYKSVLNEVWTSALPADASAGLVRRHLDEHAGRGRTAL
jgi:transcriptional regulator with XRE-family HTH domain